MAIDNKDIKLLWGRSGNRCAICKIELSEDKQSRNVAYTLGVQAHIVGEKEDAARGKSQFTEDQRNSYHNLILLCPTDHTKVDKNEEEWPIERLHFVKTEHELWVRDTLDVIANEKLNAQHMAIMSIIESATNLCDLEGWKIWTSRALAPDPHWSCGFPDMIFEFRQRVEAAIWPDNYEEFRKATISFAILLHNAASKFYENAVYRNGELVPDKFYNRGVFNPNYERDLLSYKNWLDECYKLITHATCAANWFADVVRRDFDPAFFAEKGKFGIVDGPFSDQNFIASVPEFSDQVKARYPEDLLKDE